MTAWQGPGGFEERASLRTWLYRIATSRCLNALRSASRRPAMAWTSPGPDRPRRQRAPLVRAAALAPRLIISSPSARPGYRGS